MRKILAVAVSVAIVAAVLATIFGVSNASDVRADDTLVVTVDVDEGSFIGPGTGVAGPFYVEGDTGSGAGSFQCWGWMAADGATANVSQVYNIEGGAIMTQGRERSPLAIVGGTGDFSEAEGEAFAVFTGVGFDFDMTFELD